ncbi:MAG: cation diffusion facilitator family transporter, partial [Gammaproteobacteria bacterium]
MSQQADSVKPILYALGANAAIALAKLYAAVSTGSSAMLAEAIHSVADCANQGLLLLGIKRAKRPASAEHPLGHGKAVYFWSFIVALMLFSMGGLFSVKEGAHKLHAQEPLSAPWLAIGVLVFSIAVEVVSLTGCLREVNKVRGQRSLWRWFRESRQSELIVVLGEDIAALLG